MNEKSDEIRDRIEALLFASGRKMDLEEISKLTGIKEPEVVKGALLNLKDSYETRESPLMLFEEGDVWKLTVKERHLPMIQKIVTQTELDKSIMETLAVIAWKYPVLQAEVINIRNNKAYDHLRELEESGFITRSKFGRTRQIKLTPKFFDYFDLPQSQQARDAFKNVVPEKIRDKIENSEQKIEEGEKKKIEVEEENLKKEEALRAKAKEAEEKKEVDLVDEFGRKVELEEYEKPSEQESEESEEDTSEPPTFEIERPEKEEKQEPDKEVDPEVKKRLDEINKEPISLEVEKKIDELLHPKKPAEEKTSEGSTEEQSIEESNDETETPTEPIESDEGIETPDETTETEQTEEQTEEQEEDNNKDVSA